MWRSYCGEVTMWRSYWQPPKPTIIAQQRSSNAWHYHYVGLQLNHKSLQKLPGGTRSCLTFLHKENNFLKESNLPVHLQGCKSMGDVPLQQSGSTPLNIFHEQWKIPHTMYNKPTEPNYIPPISKNDQFCQITPSPPQYRKMVSFAKSSLPMLNVDLHPCTPLAQKSQPIYSLLVRSAALLTPIVLVCIDSRHKPHIHILTTQHGW